MPKAKNLFLKMFFLYFVKIQKKQFYRVQDNADMIVVLKFLNFAIRIT
jgi:hypothetical protein